MGSNIGIGAGTPLKFQGMSAKYVLKDGTGGEIFITNVTERGMGCQHGSAPIAPGEEISIDLPFLGLRSGIVRWTKGEDCGIQMERPLDVDCLKLFSHTGPNSASDALPAPVSPKRIARS